MKLRNNSNFKLAYEVCKMPSGKLPTYIDIGRNYLYINTSKLNSTNKTLNKLADIWFDLQYK